MRDRLHREGPGSAAAGWERHDLSGVAAISGTSWFGERGGDKPYKLSIRGGVRIKM